MLDRGAQLSAFKLGSAAMPKILREKFISKYSLPAENKMCGEITIMIGARGSRTCSLDYDPNAIRLKRITERRRKQYS